MQEVKFTQIASYTGIDQQVQRVRFYLLNPAFCLGPPANFIRFSSFKQGAGSAFLCDQNLSSCSPNSRPQNVSSYSATLQDIRFGIISLYLSRKSPLLLHKKCNNCRNVVKLKDKSFVCTNYDVINCAVSHIKS